MNNSNEGTGVRCRLLSYGTFRFVDFLRTMPYCYNPNRFLVDAIDKTVGTDDNLPVRKLGKFRDWTTGIWKFLQSFQYSFRTMTKALSRYGFVFPNVFDAFKKLFSRGRRQPDPHGQPFDNNLSAS